MRTKIKAAKHTLTSSLGLSGLLECSLLVGLPLMLAGCPQPPPELVGDGYASNDPELICTVTVANPGALGGTPQTSIISVPTGGAGIDPGIVRPYYVASDCLAGVFSGEQWGFVDIQAAVADWRRFYPGRMQQLAADPTESSLLSAFPGGWCEVAGTAVCAPAGSEIGNCRPSALLTATDVALQTCEPVPPVNPPVDPPQPGGPCLAINCGAGDAVCSLTPNGNEPELFVDISFGAIPVGTNPAPGHTITLTHCGSDGDADTILTVDGALIPDSPFSEEQFSVPIPADPANPQPGENECYPLNVATSPDRVLAPGESCTVPVVFDPQNAGSHSTHYIVSSNARPDIQVDVGGTAVQQTLVVTVDPATLTIGLPTANGSVCVADTVVSPNCTAARDIELSNVGLVAVIVTGVRVEPVDISVPGDTRFEAANSFNPMVAIPPSIPLNPGESAVFQIHWCGGNNQAGNAILRFESDDANPSLAAFEQPVNRTTNPAGCQPPGEF